MSDSSWIQYVILLLVFAALIWSFRRRRRSGNVNLDAAVSVLSDVNSNLRIMEERMTSWQSKKKFQTGSWKVYRDKLGFLDSSVTSSLNGAFTMAEDFNSRIDAARKSGTMATLQDMQVDRLREPLTRGKEGLTAWLRTSYQDEYRNNPRRGGRGF